MTTRYPSKQAARDAVWDRLVAEGLARPPLPPHGRIPNFAGAREAAARLFELEPWRSAANLKVNPDTPQRHVREAALARGITVYVATPRLAGGFLKFDPARIPAGAYAAAADRARWERYAEPVALEALPAMDAIVAGSVAVTPAGRRAGKGAGYSDLEFAVLRELGHPPVPVATTVHDVQLVEDFPTDRLDQPLAAIVTPTRAIVVAAPLPAPDGIDWSRLGPGEIAAMPILATLRSRLRRR